jgi:hypothetical protein
VHCGIYSKDIGSSWIYTRKLKKLLQEITIFCTMNFDLKKTPYGFFAAISNLTKVPFLTSGFGPDYFD